MKSLNNMGTQIIFILIAVMGLCSGQGNTPESDYAVAVEADKGPLTTSTTEGSTKITTEFLNATEVTEISSSTSENNGGNEINTDSSSAPVTPSASKVSKINSFDAPKNGSTEKISSSSAPVAPSATEKSKAGSPDVPSKTVTGESSSKDSTVKPGGIVDGATTVTDTDTDAEGPTVANLPNDSNSTQNGTAKVGESDPPNSTIHDSTTTPTAKTKVAHRVAGTGASPRKSFWSTGSFFIGIAVTGFVVSVVVIARKKRSMYARRTRSFIPN